jgi:hypothetical protein
LWLGGHIARAAGSCSRGSFDCGHKTNSALELIAAASCLTVKRRVAHGIGSLGWVLDSLVVPPSTSPSCVLLLHSNATQAITQGQMQVGPVAGIVWRHLQNHHHQHHHHLPDYQTTAQATNKQRIWNEHRPLEFRSKRRVLPCLTWTMQHSSRHCTNVCAVSANCQHRRCRHCNRRILRFCGGPSTAAVVPSSWGERSICSLSGLLLFHASFNPNLADCHCSIASTWGRRGCLQGVQGGCAPLHGESNTANTDILFNVAGFPCRAHALCEIPALVDLTRKRSCGLCTGGF